MAELQSIGDILTGVIGLAARQNPEEPGDYLGDDGILRCGVCGETKRKRIECPEDTLKILCITELIVPSACACRRALLAEQERAERAKKYGERVDLLRIKSQMTAAQRRHTFENWTTSSSADIAILRVCKRYADDFERFYADNQGLLFVGLPGTGKTYAATAIANALIEKGVSVILTSMSKIMARIDSDEDEMDMLDALKRVRLLVLDDMGAERNTAYGMEKAFSVINARYESGRPMIVTTNLTGKELTKQDDIGRRRLYERVLHHCDAVSFAGATERRLQNIRKRASWIDACLEGEEGA